MSELELQWEKADNLYHTGKRDEATRLLQSIVATEVEAGDSESIRAKELSVYRLGELYAMSRSPKQLVELLKDIRPFFLVLPKSKTAKIVRKLFENIFTAGASADEQLAVCQDVIAWARSEKRSFLRLRLEHRLAEVYFSKGDSKEALDTTTKLLREARRQDERSLLVDAHLLESRIYYSVRNTSKARAALVAARTNANTINCAPLTQAEIDSQSGILHAEEKDYKTAFSYLYEAFEGLHNMGDHAREARKVLHYMLLCKIAMDNPDELKLVLNSKTVLEYKGDDMTALREIAAAWSKKDTHAFNQVLRQNPDLQKDPVMERHLNEMLVTLTQKHLLRIIAPYNRVQLPYIAELMELPVEEVESFLSQMILDKELSGIVDQQHNCLVVYDKTATSHEKDPHVVLFRDSLDTLASLDKLVTALFDKVGGKFDSLIEEHITKSKAHINGKDEDKEKDKDKKKDDNNKDKDKEKEKKSGSEGRSGSK